MSTCRTLMVTSIGDHAPQWLKRSYIPPMSKGMIRKLRLTGLLSGRPIGVSARFGSDFSLSCSHKIIYQNGPWYMPPGPVPQDPGRDEDSEDAPPPEVDEQELAAEADRITADLARERRCWPAWG